MALLDLLKKSPDQLFDKQVQQLIAFAGSGKLIDDSECSVEFRAFLGSVSSENLKSYIDQCLNQAFPDCGLALQDIVNEIGARLGADVTPGRYRGTSKHLGFDGLWKYPNGHSIVVEVKTTDAYRIDLNTIAGYQRTLCSTGAITNKDLSSMLLIIGREDTGDLEAQIRGSRYAWEIRVISVDALLRLLSIKEEVEDPTIIQRIHSILIPREFTRLDEIVNILFSATEDIKQGEETEVEEVTTVDKKSREPKFTPVAFHDACIARMRELLKVNLIKRTRTQYSNPEKTIMITCAISKEHHPDTAPGYWFAFHPHQRDALRQMKHAYVAFGCGSSKRLLLIPFNDFEGWLDGFNKTQKEDRMYWHVIIHRKDDNYILQRRKGEKPINLSKYLIPEKSP